MRHQSSIIKRLFAYEIAVLTLSLGAILLGSACAGHGGGGHHGGQSQQEASGHEGHHRRPADVQEYLARLDRPERDQYQKPDEVLAALAVQPGMAVADLGSGSGYFTRRFAEAVTEDGIVYAIDVEQEMLDYVAKSLEGNPNGSAVRLILTDSASPGLPPGSVDLVFVCNVYHHLEGKAAYFRRVKAALKPGARIAIIDFYADKRSGDVGFPRRHLVARSSVVEDMTQAGYSLLREHDFLERQYFLEFTVAGS